MDIRELEAEREIRSATFPSSDCGGRLVAISDAPLSVEGLPHQPFVPQPVVQPIPDLSYGYHQNAFTQPEAYLQQITALKPYAIRNTEYYWPFFHIEFKSQPRGGTHWVAQNLNAGSGTHSVRSMETLLVYAKCNPKRHYQLPFSVAFSASVDSEEVTLWVHWIDKSYDDGRNNPQYVSTWLNTYVFRDLSQLHAFRDHTRNIIEHGVLPRLSKR